MGDLDIVGRIRVLLSGDGAKQLDKGLKDLDRQVTKTERELDKLENTARGVGVSLTRSITGLVSSAVLTRFVGQSVQEFANLERTINATAFAMRALGIDADKELPKVIATLKAIEAAGGPALNETIATFQRFIGVTKNTAAALEATKLAADISEAGLLEVSTAAEALSNILQGRAALAAKTLGVEVRKNNGEMRTNAELLEEIARLYSGLGDQVEDTRNLLDENAAGWAELKRAAGEGLSTILQKTNEWGLNLQNLTNLAQTLGLGFTGAIAVIIEGFRNLGPVIADALNIKRLIADGPAAYREALFTSVLDGAKNVITLQESLREEFVAIWADTGAASGEAQAGAQGEAFAKLSEIANRAAAEEAAKAAAEAAEKAKEAAAKLEAERVKIATDAEDKLLAAKIAATKDGTAERLALELEMLARVRDRAIAEARRVGVETAAIEEAFRISAAALRDEYEAGIAEKDKETAEKRKEAALAAALGLLEAQAALEDEFAAERLALEAEADEIRLQEELARVEGNEKAIAAIREKWRLTRLKREIDAAEARKKVDEEEKRAKIEATLAVAQMAVGAAQAIFGENKALAIASTIISTIAAVMKALEIYGPTPLGYAAAAAAAATGAAQVAKIRSTSLGSGGGGVAAAGGAPVAATLTPQPVETFTAGRQTPVVSQDQQAPQGQAAATRTGVTYSFNGPTIVDRTSLRRFARQLREAERSDRRREL